VLPAAAVVLPPLGWLLLATLRALAAHGPGFPDALAARLLLRSLLLAALAAGIAAAMGVPYGWLAGRYRLPGRKLLLAASLLPLLLPPYAAALAWSMALTREGAVNTLLLRWGFLRAPIVPREALWLPAVILAFAYWPVVAWATLFAARSVPVELEASARLHLPDGAAARWSAWPALARSLPAAALLVFLLALADFGVANSLGVQTYPVDIVNQFQSDRNAGMTARLAVPLLLVVIPLVLLQLRLLDRLPASGGGARGQRLLGSRAQAWFAACGCVLILGLSSLVPLSVLAAGSLPLSTYPSVWNESSDHFLNTLLTAGGGAALAVGVALLHGWAVRGRRLPLLDLGLTLPYALPASLVGVAMIQILNRPGPAEWLYTSLGGLAWTYAALFFPFALKTLQPAWGLVDSDLLDEGAMLGAGAWAQFQAAAWPALKPYAAAALAIVALLSAREIDATALLGIPGGDTVAFRIQDYLHFAPGPKMAALCVLVVLLSGAGVGALAAWAGKE
jgi:ABC-type Fe3+ transport system permease subunit